MDGGTTVALIQRISSVHSMSLTMSPLRNVLLELQVQMSSICVPSDLEVFVEFCDHFRILLSIVGGYVS